MIPTLDLPREDLLDFAQAVTGRFKNPYIKHSLLAICLNSVSKWRARCMPSLLEYVKRFGELPERLTFSLASLMALYHGGRIVDGKLECKRGEETYTLQDEAAVLEFFVSSSDLPAAEQVAAFLCREDFFGPDLIQIPGLKESVAASYQAILERGMTAVMNEKFGV